MPGFFIERPIFAWVIAILISLGGVLAIANLGVESYPEIAPPQINVQASYPGASADTVEKSVTQVIEQQLTSIDNLLYFSSSSSSNGSVSITLTFASGTNPDTAQVQVQNRVALATPRLPSEVTQQGVSVSKSNSGFLMIVALTSDDGSVDRNALNNIIDANLKDPISRLPGVGSTQQFGSGYAMRIWLNPDKLRGYDLSATDVLDAVRGQNVQFAAGSIGGAPAVKGQGYTATVTAESRFSTPQQFRNIILRANNDGSTVRLKDVARVALGPAGYGFNALYNGKPSGGLAVILQPGANALTVAQEVRDKMAQLQDNMPQHVNWFVPFDSTTFVRTSIHEVVQTLVEAVILVFLVMLLFLQNFRATLIPTLIIPVALLGTFLGMLVLGFTINQLTLFGMVLAIGIVVDDAIVVIENVERIMTEENLPPKEATRKAMQQITGAVVAISVVLAAVFIPSALQTGSTGAIYRQFALTIALSTGFSALLALSFTPALCASLLKPEHHEPKNRLYRGFNRFFAWTLRGYTRHVGKAITHTPRWMMVFALLTVLCGFLFMRMPGSFLPNEDQGIVFVVVQLPPGATSQRTTKVLDQVKHIVLKDPAVKGMFQVTGFSFMGSGENAGMAFIRLKDWSKRNVTAEKFIQRTNRALFMNVHDGMVFMANLPTIRGLGEFGGFDMYLQDRSGQGYAALAQARQVLLSKAEQSPVLSNVRQNGLPDSPQIHMTVNRAKAESMGLSVSDVYNAIQLMLAPVYVNDFNYEGRVKRVIMQADAPYRMNVDALSHFYTPSSNSSVGGADGMIPLSGVVHTKWTVGPPSLTRYNGYSALQIVGDPAPGYSTGQAMAAMQRIVSNDLPPGFGVDWSGQSYQEMIAGNQAPLLFGLSIIVVFLALAALYESWSVPISVLLVVPLGVLGAVVLTMLRGMPNDVYFKVGLITIIGVAAKNAILIVEFAVAEQKNGRSLREGVVEAARLRLRPILMTSLSFMLGVLPLAVSSGPGANARHAIGTGVIGGMLFATALGLLLIPVFFVAVRRLLGDRLDPGEPTANHLAGPEPFDSDPRR